MLRRTMVLLCLALATAAGAQPSGAMPDPKDALEGNALIEALRGGGYTLYFRHAARVRTTPPPPSNRPGCPDAEALSPIGLSQARGIGEAIAALRIPIGESIASPMCRTLQTAELVAGRATTNEDVRQEGSREKPFEALAKMLAEPIARGTNRLVSGHVAAWQMLQGHPVLQEGEAAIFRGDGKARVLVARLRAEDWKTYSNPPSRRVLAERSSLADPQMGLSDAPLVDALRSGGYTVYFRHGVTDHSQKDLAPFDAGDCKRQRNLSVRGRMEGTAIGDAIATLKLPVGEVISSPYCRTMDTARLLTGKEPTPHDALRGMSVAAKGKFDFRDLKEMFTVPVKTGTLRFIVGHGNGLMETMGLPEPAEGEATVLRATPAGGWIVIARIRPEQWAPLKRSVDLP